MNLLKRLFGNPKKKNSPDFWMGLNAGDVVEYKGRQFLYEGINPNGGPGMFGVPEPIFRIPRPSVTYEGYITYYLRNYQIGQLGNIPQIMLESEPPRKAGRLNYIAFLNATREELIQKGHISRDEWTRMGSEIWDSLLKSAEKASKVIARALNEKGYPVKIDIDSPHLVYNPPFFEVKGCQSSASFQFYLDERKRIAITLPKMDETEFWRDDGERTKKRSLESDLRSQLNCSEMVFLTSEDEQPEFLKHF